MSSKLRLLIDESVTDPLAKGILGLCSGAVYVRSNPALKGKQDRELAEVANVERRMIVALDSDYDYLTVHEGVIRLNAGRLSESCLLLMFSAFWRSGFRAKAKSKRTFITNEGIRITNGSDLNKRWTKHPCGNTVR